MLIFYFQIRDILREYGFIFPVAIYLEQKWMTKGKKNTYVLSRMHCCVRTDIEEATRPYNFVYEFTEKRFCRKNYLYSIYSLSLSLSHIISHLTLFIIYTNKLKYIINMNRKVPVPVPVPVPLIHSWKSNTQFTIILEIRFYFL